MRVREAEFVAGVASLDAFPREPLPEIAFLGPSNVGKSSLVNALLNRRQLARVSRTPGRTQQINVFRLDGAVHFVDLPGYGFAKVPREVQDRFLRLVEQYLAQSRHLKLLLLLQDSRRTPSQRDLDLVRWLSQNAVPHAVVLTKADKVPRNRLRAACDSLRRAFDRPDLPVVPFSILSGTGLRETWALIDHALGRKPDPRGDAPQGEDSDPAAASVS